MTCVQKIKSVEAKSISPYQKAKMSIAYIDYRTLDDEFYPLKRVCHLLEFDKLTLKEKCEAYAIRPQRNEVGEWGLTRYDLRMRTGRIRAARRMRGPGHDGAADRGGDRRTAEDDKTASPQDDRPAPYSRIEGGREWRIDRNYLESFLQSEME